MRPTQVSALLANVKGVTFANVEYETVVATAAAFKNVRVTKRVVANVQLFNNLKAFTNVYRNAVERSTGKPFELSETHFEHTECFSVVKHKTKNAFYLYCIYNNVQSSEYFIDGVSATKSQVLAMMTPSAAAAANSAKTYNAKNGVTHDVIVRTIGLENVTKITACGAQI